MNILTQLNEEQLDIVKTKSKYTLVLAGAGSGKTRTLVYRLAYLVEKGTLPEEIMLLTFTNKAAREMLNRAKKLVGGNFYFPFGGTFHSIANSFLKRFNSLLNIDRDYSILDKSDEKDLIKDCIIISGYKNSKEIPKPKIVSMVYSLMRNSCEDLETTLKHRLPSLIKHSEFFSKVIKTYEIEKYRHFSVDFDDLLSLWDTMLDFKECRDFIKQRISYILVDEYQDTNKLQFSILRKLCSITGNLMVVGDDAQSIYSFRAAEIGNIMRFKDVFPEQRIYKLTTNYRSSPQILDFANNSISKNNLQFEKVLIPVNETGPLPSVMRCQDQKAEANFIVTKIQEFREKGMNLSEISILFRARYQSVRLEMSLINNNIDYVVRGGMGFFEQSHIKDIIALLQIISNPQNLLAFKRIIKMFPGIGPKSAEKLHLQFLSEYFTKKMGSELPSISGKKAMNSFKHFKEIFDQLIKEKNPKSIIMNFLNNFYREYISKKYDDPGDREKECEELALLSGKYQSLNEFLNEAVLDEEIRSSDNNDEKKERVTLSTIHQAKGLEWDCVFIIGVNHEIFPDSRHLEKNALEEERRLFYVAVTRAKRHLFISYPELIEKYNSLTLGDPSCFITEIPKNLYESFRVRNNNLFF